MTGPIHNHGFPHGANPRSDARGLDPGGLLNGLLGRGQSAGSAFNTVVQIQLDLSPSGLSLPGAHGDTGAASSATPALTPSPAVDPAVVSELFGDLPADLQQAVLRDFGSLSQPVRDAFQQLSINPPASQGNPVSDTVSTATTTLRDAGNAARSDFVSATNSANQALGSTTQSAANQAANQAATAFGVREAGAQQAAAFAIPQANPQASTPQAGERTVADLAQSQQVPGRAGDALVAGRALDTGNVVVMADRNNALQQQAQSQQTVPSFAPQGRADALPAQAMATLAGATMLANPQGNPMLAQASNTQGIPAGLDAAARQAREAQLAPAGHTVAGFFRRDRRKARDQQLPPGAQQGQSLLQAMLPNRKARDEQDAEENTATRWMFWILTIAAYACVALAVVTMIPAGGRLLDASGHLNVAGYSLIAAGVTAVLAFVLGRLMGRR